MARRELEATLDEKLKNIKKDFVGRDGPGDLVEQMGKTTDATNVYALKLQEIEDTALTRLHMEIDNFRRRVAGTKAAMKGRPTTKGRDPTNPAMQHIQNEKAAWQEQIDKVERDVAAQIRELDPTTMNWKGYEAKLDEVAAD